MRPIGAFQEAEGLTIIIEESRAIELGIPILFRAAWITLEVHSDLAAVGLSAAVAAALAREKIACNIIAAAHHDHLFVPAVEAKHALDVLGQLSRTVGG